MPFTDQEILETVRMIELEALDIRTTTLGISLRDCAMDVAVAVEYERERGSESCV